MPIRMTDDPYDPNEQDDSGGGGRRPNLPGGGGGLMNLLPMLLGLLKGKGSILLLLIAAGGYFLLNKSGGCNPSQIQNLFSKSGYNFNKDTFQKASIYEELEITQGEWLERQCFIRFTLTLKK